MLLAVVSVVAAGLTYAADVSKPAARTEVFFDHPEKFTDVKDDVMASDSGRDSILASLSQFLVRETADRLPAGDKLSITFTDIDLAGEFEPWRGPQWDGVRIYKDIYPPAFKFSYAVTDASGKVVKSGTESIRDVDYQMRGAVLSNDPLRYEKSILEDWARLALRDLK